MPWITSLCWAGSMSGTPLWLIEKCSPLGVTVPPKRWCGVRACELRNSPVGLLSERTTSFSKGDDVCTAGSVEPNSRLHGLSCTGSAAAPVAVPAALIAPASAMPCPSRTRRLIRPLPATLSREGARHRLLDVLMISSLTRGSLRILVLCYAALAGGDCRDKSDLFRKEQLKSRCQSVGQPFNFPPIRSSCRDLGPVVALKPRHPTIGRQDICGSRALFVS